MNVATLTADRTEAARKRDHYAAALERYHDDEYAAAHQVYWHLARGETLIDVGIAIRDGGFDDQMRPRLALARADRHQVHFEWRPHSDVATFDTQRGARQYPQLVERVNFNRLHGRRTRYGDTYYRETVEGWALVPLVPPDLRPGANLRGYHILWEVEQWADRPIAAQPDIDPFLLERVAGDLFRVVAEWDLTPIERMVMQGRARVQG